VELSVAPGSPAVTCCTAYCCTAYRAAADHDDGVISGVAWADVRQGCADMPLSHILMDSESMGWGGISDLAISSPRYT
jgi:hypothetical protein